jgi:hypothetical protein
MLYICVITGLDKTCQNLPVRRLQINNFKIHAFLSPLEEDLGG